MEKQWRVLEKTCLLAVRSLWKIGLIPLRQLFPLGKVVWIVVNFLVIRK